MRVDGPVQWVAVQAMHVGEDREAALQVGWFSVSDSESPIWSSSWREGRQQDPHRRFRWWGPYSPAKGYVARGGVEPPTFRFSVGRSYQLSYLAVLGP